MVESASEDDRVGRSYVFLFAGKNGNHDHQTSGAPLELVRVSRKVNAEGKFIGDDGPRRSVTLESRVAPPRRTVVEYWA